MTYLPSLIKKIDYFYSFAEAQGFVARGAPEDMRLYSELSDMAKEVVNPEVHYTLQILAAMFLRALELNDGFNIIYKTINGISDDLDLDEDEQANVSNVLNKINAAIAGRAARPDSATALRELQKVASDTKRNLADLEGEPTEEEEREDEVSPYEASLIGAPSPEETETEELFREEGVGALDPSSLSREPGKGGMSVGVARNYKEWADVYAAEKAKYQKYLEGSDELLTKTARTARQNSQVRLNLKSLIGVLDQLESLTKEALKLEGTILLETEVPHPAEEARLAEIRTSLRALEKQRNALKKSTSTLYKAAELQNLEESLSKATDLKDKFLLQQKIDLQKLRLSPASGKGKEAFERKKLIDALQSGTPFTSDIIRNQMEAIKKAQEFTAKITETYRKRAVELAKTRGIKPTEIKTKQERIDLPKMGITVKRHEYDEANMNLANYTQKITESLFAKRKTFKDALLRKLKNEGLEELKPYAEDVATAANKGANIGWAAHRLSEQIRLKETMGKSVPKKELMTFLFSIRVSKLLYNFRDQLNQINGWLGLKGQKEEGTDIDFSKLDPAQLQVINHAVKYGEELISRFKAYEAKLPSTGPSPEWSQYPGPATVTHPEFRTVTFPAPFGPTGHKGITVTDWIQKLVNYLKERLIAAGALQ
jgi:hypothetical protein